MHIPGLHTRLTESDYLGTDSEICIFYSSLDDFCSCLKYLIYTDLERRQRKEYLKSGHWKTSQKLRQFNILRS